MRLTIRRMSRNQSAITGVLSVDGVDNCLTLERVGVEFPAGTYRVTLSQSAALGRLLPILHSVPGRTAIRIHSVNKLSELKGCVGVGQRRTNDEMGFEFPARPAESRLVALIQSAIERNEDVTVSVEDATAQLESADPKARQTQPRKLAPASHPGISLFLNLVRSLSLVLQNITHLKRYIPKAFRP